MHIAIVGAGINGLISALELIEQGCSVTIIDQQQAGKAASWAGGGILSPMYPWRYPQAVNDLARYAKPMYQAWNEKLKPYTGIDFEIHDSGMLIFDKDDFEVGLNYADQQNNPIQQSQLLQHQQLKKINPKISSNFDQALYFSQLANVRNPRLLQSISHYLKNHPHVIWHEHAQVRQLNSQFNHLNSAELSNGQYIKADHFIFSTGAWSARWSASFQLEIPVRPIQGQMLLFKTPTNWLPTMCMNKVMYLIPRKDGHIVCGSSMRDLGFDTTPDPHIRNKILEASIEMVPELANFPIVQEWAGLRPSSPQGIPFIGQIPELENAWANFGHFRNGLCMAPASAQLLRQLILKQPTFMDADAYSPMKLTHLNSMANQIS